MSRPRSGRAASTVASPRQGGRSSGGGRPGVFVQAPKSDIYVALLGVSVGAMFLGCLLLLLVWSRYDFKVAAPKAMAPVTAPIYALATAATLEVESV
jgi:hypothetical protein